jgi:predicted Zn-dependent protease
MTREEMLAYTSAVLDAVRAPHATARLTEERTASVRFGQNRITQNMDTFTRTLDLAVGDGSRKAVLHSHRIDPSAIPDIVSQAADLLRDAPPDPEYMPPVEGGQVYPVLRKWDEATAAAAPAPRIDAALSACAKAAGAGAEASGIAAMAMEKTALGTSTGNLCYDCGTQATFQLTIHAGGGSSYRSTVRNDWGGIDFEETAGQVLREALDDRDPEATEAGEMDIVLEPQAVADLLPFLLGNMNRRLSDEGVTVFAGREGSKVTSGLFNLSSELGGAVPGRSFDEEGLPSRDVAWIGDGVLRNMFCERYWASKAGVEPLSSPDCFYVGGGPGGDSSAMAAGAGRCLRIRRFWYIRYVDMKSLELTGMTRDGVFLVEGGEARPMRDFRWNWRLLDLFSRIELLGSPERKGWAMVPPMLLRGVRI